MRSVCLSLAVAAALLVMPAAFAAKPAAQSAPAAAAANGGAQPQANRPVEPSETKGFGDWTVRCYPVSSVSPCEMLELRVAKKTGQRILGVLLVYIPSRNEHVMQISVPLGVALQSGLVVHSDTYNSPVMRFRRCDQQGCYVEVPIDNGAVSSLARATKAQATIVSADGRKFDLVFSMSGFADAHRALVDLTKQKAVNPPPQAQAPDNAAPAQP